MEKSRTVSEIIFCSSSSVRSNASERASESASGSRLGAPEPETFLKDLVAAPRVLNPVLVASYVTRSTFWRRPKRSANSDPVMVVSARMAAPIASIFVGFSPGVEFFWRPAAVGGVGFLLIITSCSRGGRWTCGR